MNYVLQLVIKFGLVLTVCFFASCVSEQTVTTSKKRSGLDKYNNGYEIEKGEHGMMQSGSDKVSQYDRKRSSVGVKDFSGKDYNKESYRKKRWGGNRGYTAKRYEGNTDGSQFRYSPHYVNRNANAQANGQYSTANQSQYDAGTFYGGGIRANEGGLNKIKKGASGYVVSRDNAAMPLIMSREEYNQLGVQDTNRMLGREWGSIEQWSMDLDDEALALGMVDVELLV